jgi:hypothetical protein
MPIEQRPDPSSIRTGVPIVQSPSGKPLPSGVLDTDAYEAAINQAGDGVEATGPLGQLHYYDDLLRSESWPDEGGGITTMHPRDAAMLALGYLVRRMRWQSKDLRTIGGGSDEAPRPPAIVIHQLERIHFDWPEWSSTDIPVANALITSPEPARWNADESVRSSYLITKTANVFAPGTVLRYLGEFEIPLKLIVWFAHKDQRRGFDARIGSLLAAERTSEAWHRRVIVPEYFGQEVKLMMGESLRPDDSAQAQANRWPLEISMTAEVTQVELVRIPGYVSAVSASVEVDGES